MIENEYKFKLEIKDHTGFCTGVNDKQVYIYKRREYNNSLDWIILSIHRVQLLHHSNKAIFNSFYYNKELYSNLINNGDIEFNISYFDLKTPKIIYLTPKLLLQLC